MNKNAIFGRSVAARIAAVAIFACLSTSAVAQPSFSKSFSPDTIGPGSISTLTFQIDSESPDPITDLAFTDVLPAGVVLATPSLPTTGCGDIAVLSAPDGGDTITLSNGKLGAFGSCTVSVLVTGSTPGIFQNVSGDLSSSDGNSGPATADLTVATDRPGFSKGFSPSSQVLGSRSTLTFAIDNSANDSNINNIRFTDEMPGGLVIADPPNIVNTCTAGIFTGGIVTAMPGTSTISLGTDFGINNAAVLAGGTCSISVDVIPQGIGSFANVTGDLLSRVESSFTDLSSGQAAATLDSAAGDLHLIKSFIDDPVPPGGIVDLEFNLLNRTRSDDAFNIAFTDDLDATLSGLTAISTPQSACGGTLTGSSVLSLTGGALPAQSECVFTVSLQVPAAATAGIYPNVSSSLTADVGGTPVVGDAASDDLFVFAAPTVEKSFLDDPVAAGGTTRLEFTVTNTSPDSGATDIAFTDVFDTIFPTASAVPNTECCGTGSTCNFSQFFNPPPPSDSVPAQFRLSGGSLGPGESCTFELTLDVDNAASSGIYPNATTAVTATVDGDSLSGAEATDEVEVVGGPVLAKAFIDNAAAPGETTTLRFTLSHGASATTDATGINFTDDLNAALAGLTAVGLPASDVCGPGSTLAASAGDSLLALTDGILAPGESCAFDVTVQVPASATAGIYTNTTSSVNSTVSGFAITTPEASDDLTVAGLTLTKAFLDDPVIPGASTTLQFTLANAAGAPAASNISFQDQLASMASGLTFSPGSVPATPCGASSDITLLSGNATLSFSGGSLGAGETCQFSLTVDVAASVSSATYRNLTSNFSATIDDNTLSLTNASDLLTVESNLLLLSKQFIGDPVQPDESLTLQIGVTNQSATETVNAIALTDDLGATLAGMLVSSIDSNDCGFTVDLNDPAVLDLSGGSLAPLASCTLVASTLVPPTAPAGVYVNTTSDASGLVNGDLNVSGTAASDDFRVVAVSFTKAFDGPSTATGTATLTFNLTNLDSTSGIGSLAFTDDLDAVIPGLTAVGLPANDVCGAGSLISGTSFLTFSGGELAPNGSPGDSCAISITVAVPAAAAAGSYLNATSPLTSAGLRLNDPATASLAIEPAPTFSKVFAPNTIAVGGTSTLTFEIENTASALAAADLAFTDNLPAGLVVAATPNPSTTCSGGTLTAVAGTGTISLTGSSVAAGAACTVSVDTTATAEGVFSNTSGDLTSTSGNSGSASDTITAVAGDFVVAKSFRTAPVLPGGLVELELSIVNGSAFPLTDISLSDDLGAVLPGLVSEGLPINDTCGAGSQIAGTSFLTLTGGNLAAGASCTIVVPIRVPTDAPEGIFPNTTSTAQAIREGVGVQANPASGDLEVAFAQFAKALNPSVTSAGASVVMSFAITNPDPANGVANLQFSDDLGAFISGMTASGIPLGVCSTGTLAFSGSTLTLSGATLPAGGTCNFQVQVNVPGGTAEGTYTNTTSAAGGDIDGNSVQIAAATADLEIEPPPTFAKAFSPASIGVDGTSALTLTIDNSASTLPADSLAFVDNFPAPLLIATPATTSNTCGGTLTAPEGAAQLQLSGGSIPAGGTCQVQVDVTAGQTGVFTNTTGDLTSSLGNSGTATADLTVVPGPVFTKSFSPATIGVDGQSTLTLTIDNSSSTVAADALAFVDNFPAPLLIATPATSSNTCGGTLTAPEGAAQLQLSGGSVPAGSTCQVQVDVTAGQTGVFTNTTGDLTSSLGNSGTASAELEIVAAPVFSKAFSPTQIALGEPTRLIFTIDNTANAVQVDSVSFVDPLPAGMFVADDPAAINGCGGTLVAAAGTASVELSGGSVSASSQCTVSVNVITTIGGALTNTTDDLTSSLGNSGSASAQLTLLLEVPVANGIWILILLLALLATTWYHTRRS